MNDNLKLSLAGANLIKHFESCLKKVGEDRYTSYKCPANVLTIGWGHTNHHGAPFNSGDVWPMSKCDSVFLEDMLGFEKEVKRLVTVPLAQHQFDALVSFTYNCGGGNLAKSTLLKKVNAKNWEGAAAEFAKWNKGGGKVLAGLTRRRASESLLFQNIPDENYDGKPDHKVKPMPDPMPQQVDEPYEV
jgi:lysozyme